MFKKHYSRLILEAVVKATLMGLAIGCGANFLAALAAWYTTMQGISAIAKTRIFCTTPSQNGVSQTINCFISNLKKYSAVMIAASDAILQMIHSRAVLRL